MSGIFEMSMNTIALLIERVIIASNSKWEISILPDEKFH